MASVKVIHLLQNVAARGVGGAKNVRHFHQKVGVIGVPFDKGQVKEGVGQAPDELRRAGVIESMRAVGCEVTDYGNITYEFKQDNKKVSNMIHLEHIAACQEEVSKKVQEIVSRGELCVTLGGDHTVSIGTVDGHQKAKGDLALLWVDAHADLNTNATSPSGNVHGMPVALLARELADYWPYLPGMDWQMPRISIRNIGYIGLRDLDAYERLTIDKWGVAAYGMDDVLRLGALEALRQIRRRIDPRQRRSLHLSFDVDSLDPLEAPSTGTPVRGGLSLREALALVEEVRRSGRLAAVDLVEFNPAVGDARDRATTVEACRSVLRAACGHSRSGALPPDEDLPLPRTPSPNPPSLTPSPSPKKTS
ncbi:hypothetical protein R5R35_009256 [Gryllus longicercus]|uniref:Arginase n=1 Tax=Gryllus longicercus TaxID=2509291 RepID=A0AAN9VIG9_9ORTH